MWLSFDQIICLLVDNNKKYYTLDSKIHTRTPLVLGVSETMSKYHIGRYYIGKYYIGRYYIGKYFIDRYYIGRYYDTTTHIATRPCLT